MIECLQQQIVLWEITEAIETIQININIIILQKITEGHVGGR